MQRVTAWDDQIGCRWSANGNCGCIDVMVHNLFEFNNLSNKAAIQNQCHISYFKFKASFKSSHMGALLRITIRILSQHCGEHKELEISDSFQRANFSLFEPCTSLINLRVSDEAEEIAVSSKNASMLNSQQT